MHEGKLMHSTRIAAVLIALVSLPTVGIAQELINESVPFKWLADYAPEKLPELKFPAYFDEFDKAKALVFGGRYKAGLLALQKVQKADPAELAQTKAAALAAIGRREEAVKVLSEPAIADQGRIQIARAGILSDMGRHNEALAILKAHLDKDTDSLSGHYALACTAEKIGDLRTASTHYEWIYKKYYDQWQGQGAKEFEDAEQVTTMGRAFDRYATLNGLYAGNPGLNNVMLKVFLQAYDIIDRNYWPAHVAAAEFYMARGNSREAAKELTAALSGNPNDIRSRVLAGLIALERWNFDAADTQIEAIRKVNRQSIEGELLEARALLQQRRPRDAEAPLSRALSAQPNHIEAMGLLAGAYALQLQEDKVRELLQRVEKIDPDNATAYVELAEQLSAMRQYPRAEKTYKMAIERAPWMTAARNGLGLLLTQSGDEEQAKVVLDAAYKLDPFNFRTTNYLILLDKMAKMDRKESEHFILVYDKVGDPLVPEYFVEYLESIHKEVCDNYKHEPSVKTIIEVFPTHDAFSARITGSPWIGTVGACTGRVIALCTPRRGDATLGTYNWAQVLRHEYTHTVTLSATENRIAHWLTEGLAVSEEQSPLRWEWVPMLHNAVTKKELFSMEDLTWAFVRPKRPQDRTMAYAQSFWVCQYIEQRWGHEALLGMMELFRQGRTEHEVFQEVLGISTSAFSPDFFAWAEKQVAQWGYDAETSSRYNELVAKAEQMVRNREYADAVTAWLEIAGLRPMDALPHQRLAGLYMRIDKPREAIAHLIRLNEVSLKDNKIAKGIVRILLENNDSAGAEKYAIDAVYIDPYDLAAHELLLAVYQKTGNQAGIDREKRVIPVLSKWLADQRRKAEGLPPEERKQD